MGTDRTIETEDGDEVTVREAPPELVRRDADGVQDDGEGDDA